MYGRGPSALFGVISQSLVLPPLTQHLSRPILDRTSNPRQGQQERRKSRDQSQDPPPKAVVACSLQLPTHLSLRSAPSSNLRTSSRGVHKPSHFFFLLSQISLSFFLFLFFFFFSNVSTTCSMLATTLLLAFLHPTVTIIRITRGFSVFLWYRHATQGRFLLASPSFKFARHLLLVHTSQSTCFDYWTRKTRRVNRCYISSRRLQYFSLIYNRILVTPFSPTHLPSKHPVASSLLSILKFITLSNWSLA